MHRLTSRAVPIAVSAVVLAIALMLAQMIHHGPPSQSPGTEKPCQQVAECELAHLGGRDGQRQSGA